MAKRDGKSGQDGLPSDNVILERLRRHLQFLGLTRTLAELDDRLAWATRERPCATALLERIWTIAVRNRRRERLSSGTRR